MKLFSACAIVLVVVGHIVSSGFNGPFDMFEPYSFQVAAFVFVSGYFYKVEHERCPWRYLEARIRRLVIPLLSINAAYGCITLLLRKCMGFEWGGVASLSVQSLLVDPFTNGHQFLINMPMWFIAPLFFAEVANIIVRLALARISCSARKELGILLAYLLVGSLAIGVSGDEGLPPGSLLLACRTAFFLACLGMGRFYSAVLEKHDKLPNTPYFAILLSAQFLLIVILGGHYTYVPSWCRFPAGVVGTYCVTMTGIAFLMRCCKILSPVLGRARPVLALSDNTFSIMCHHMFGFFLVTSLFAILAQVLPGIIDFDYPSYLSSYSYRWMPPDVPQFSFLYVCGAILVSLGIHRGWQGMVRRWRGRRTSRA